MSDRRLPHRRIAVSFSFPLPIIDEQTVSRSILTERITPLMPGESLLNWMIFGAICVCLFAIDRIIKAKHPTLYRASSIATWAMEIGLLLLCAAGLVHLLITGRGF